MVIYMHILALLSGLRQRVPLYAIENGTALLAVAGGRAPYPHVIFSFISCACRQSKPTRSSLAATTGTMRSWT